MPSWFPPFAAASFAVLVLNIALLLQQARRRAQEWPTRFRRDLRRWDGRLPEDIRRGHRRG